MIEFTDFIGIDWSGAKGATQRALKVARCNSRGDCHLVPPPTGRHWSRKAVADYIAGLQPAGRILIGIDSSFSLPFSARAYLPGSDIPATSAKALWAHIDAVSAADRNYGCDEFVTRYGDWFHTPNVKGPYTTAQPLYRVTETLCQAQRGLRAETSFKLIGPSQVGKSALTTMRVLHRLSHIPRIAIWPFDAVGAPDGKPDSETAKAPTIVIVETYAAIMAQHAGFRGKIRDWDSVAAALGALSARMSAGAIPSADGPVNDDMADALLIAAGLRAMLTRSQAASQGGPEGITRRHGADIAAMTKEYWQPGGDYPMVRQSEGWTFGVV